MAALIGIPFIVKGRSLIGMAALINIPLGALVNLVKIFAVWESDAENHLFLLPSKMSNDSNSQ